MTELTRAETAHRAAFWAAVAAAARDRAAAFAAALEAQARDELEREGTAPSWRIPGLGSVILEMSNDRVDIVDERAYIEWVARRHPTEIETRVRPAFDAHLRAQAAARGSACDDQGEVIPGLAFRAGGQPCGIQRRIDPAAKAGAAAAAAAYLEAMPALSIEPL